MQNSELNNFKNKRLGIVVHDAGGANNILYWLQSFLQNNPSLPWKIYARGPAIKLLNHLFPHKKSETSLLQLVKSSELLMTGTSWGSAIEHQARQLAFKFHLPNITMLDHWVNYKDRFLFEGHHYIPDEIWVVDSEAYHIAHSLFPKASIVQIENYYFKAIQQSLRVTPYPKTFIANILYVLEPIRETWNNQFMPGEFQALSFFFSQIQHITSKNKVKVWLRPHPSESKEKYLPWCKTLVQATQTIHVKLDTKTDILSTLQQSDYVVGCGTTAMALALYLEKIVFCSVPPGAPPCALPHSKIQHLAQISHSSNLIKKPEASQ